MRAQEGRAINLVVGYANVDLIARVKHLPAAGERLTADRIEVVPGGMAANCACAAAALGAGVVFFGSVGNDSFAEIVRADFERFDVDFYDLSEGASHTTLAMITVTPGGDRSIISEPTPYRAAKLHRYLTGFKEQPGILYVDGYHLGVAAAEIALAREVGFTTFCDLDGAPDTYPRGAVLTYLDDIDIVQWHAGISARLFPGHSPERANELLLERVSTLIYTAGNEEVVLFTGSETFRFPVPAVNEVVDTTGAGDVLAGAFMALYSESRSFESAIRGAIEVAASSVRYPGARAGLDNLD